MAKSSRYHSESRTESLSDAIGNAYGEIEALADEMGEWRDSLEEKFSATEKYSRVSEAADTLDSYREAPEFDDSVVENLTVTFSETVKRKSRSGPSRDVRLGNAVSRLTACVDALDEKINDLEEQQEAIREKAEGESIERGSIDDLEEQKAALEDLRDKLQEAVDNLDGGVEFPGMFG